MQSELKNIENEFLNNKTNHFKNNYQINKRKNIKSESEADVRNNEINEHNNSLQKILTIKDNNSKTIISNNKHSSSKTFTKGLKIKEFLKKSSYKNVIEYGIEPDVPTSSNVMLMSSVLLRADMENRKNNLITKMVNMYICLLKVNSNGIWNNNNNRLRKTSDLNCSDENFSSSHISHSHSSTSKKTLLNLRRKNNSTSSSKSFKNTDNQSLHQKCVDSLEQSSSNLTRLNDPLLPKDVAYAITLNPTANTKLKANMKGIELIVKNNYNALQHPPDVITKLQSCISSLSTRSTAKQNDTLSNKFERKRIF